ncbi:MAG: alpha/beta hydrolase [Dehalococcoidia bacterium]|nr:alpha/beta hydrolase [Dehalococcoidia bacterium]
MKGDGHPVVMLHGVGGGAADWSRNEHWFADRGFRVFTPDLPGHGRSDPPPTGWKARNMSRLAVDILDALGLESATLVGHSAGGMLAAHAALDYPERLDALVLVAPAGIQRSVGWSLRLLTIPLVGEFLLRPNPTTARTAMVSMFEDASLIPQDIMDTWIKRRKDPQQRRFFFRLLRAGVGIAGTHRDLVYRSQLTDLRPPTLIVWGVEDRVVPIPNGLDDLVEGNPRTRSMKLSPCGHWPQVEQAERFNTVVTDFLQAEVGSETSDRS